MNSQTLLLVAAVVLLAMRSAGRRTAAAPAGTTQWFGNSNQGQALSAVTNDMIQKVAPKEYSTIQGAGGTFTRLAKYEWARTDQ